MPRTVSMVPIRTGGAVPSRTSVKSPPAVRLTSPSPTELLLVRRPRPRRIRLSGTWIVRFIPSGSDSSPGAGGLAVGSGCATAS